MSNYLCYGIVTIDGQVYALDAINISKINTDGETRFFMGLKYYLDSAVKVVSFQNKIYITRPRGKDMICCDPVAKTVKYELPGCQLGMWFCCCGSDKFIYAMGGFNTEISATIYDPLTNLWIDIAPMKYGRYESVAAAMNNRIYVLGGWDNPPPEVYDAQSSTWNEISKMKVHRSSFSACVINNQLYAVGRDEKAEKSIEVYDRSQWKIVTDFEFNTDIRDLDPQQPQNGQVSLEQLSKEVSKEINQHLADNVPKISEVIGRSGCHLSLPGVEIKIPEGALKEENAVSFSTRTVTDQEDDLIDVAPRLQTNSPVKFWNPVSVKMETSISAPAGETIPLTLHQRNSPDEEWKEIEHLNVGKRNEVDFDMNCSEETRLTINFQEMRKGVKKKITKWRKGIADHFKIRVHAREDFYINRETLLIVATFNKDRNTQNSTEAVLQERNFVPFAISPHQFAALLGTTVTPKMVCKSPMESKFKDEVFPFPSFTADNDFLAEGTRCFYFELDPEPTNQCKRIKLMFECSLNGRLNHKLPLTTNWPLELKGDGRSGNTIEGTSAAFVTNSTFENLNLTNCNVTTTAIGQNKQPRDDRVTGNAQKRNRSHPGLVVFP